MHKEMASGHVNDLLLWGREKLLQEQLKSITQQHKTISTSRQREQVEEQTINGNKLSALSEMINEGEDLILAALDAVMEASIAMKRENTSEVQEQSTLCKIKELTQECEEEIRNARIVLKQAKDTNHKLQTLLQT